MEGGAAWRCEGVFFSSRKSFSASEVMLLI